MIALVFVILNQLLQWRGEFHLYLSPVLEYLLVNSAARRFLMAWSQLGQRRGKWVSKQKPKLIQIKGAVDGK